MVNKLSTVRKLRSGNRKVRTDGFGNKKALVRTGEPPALLAWQ